MAFELTLGRIIVICISIILIGSGIGLVSFGLFTEECEEITPEPIFNNVTDDHDQVNNITSYECVKQANIIESLMNRSANPCDHFYRFACGQFIANKSEDDQLRQLQSKVNLQLDNLLHSDVQVAPDVPQVSYVRKLYKNCVSIDRSNSSHPLKDIIDRVTSTQDTLDKIALVMSLNEPVIVDLKVKSNPFDSSKKVIWLDQPRFGIPRIELLSRKANNISLKNVYSYSNFSSLALNLTLGGEISYSEMVQRAIDFEVELAKKTTKPFLHNNHKESLLNLTLGQLNAETVDGPFDFVQLINKVAEFAQSNIQVTPDDMVIVGDMSYLKSVGKILADFANVTHGPDGSFSPLDTYLSMRIVLAYTFLAHPDLNSLEKSHLGNFSRVRNFDLKDRCLNLLRQYTPELIDRFYTEIHSPSEEDIEKVTKIKNTIVRAFIDSLARDPELSWDDSRKLAFKALHIHFNFGYPEWILNSSLLAQHTLNLGSEDELEQIDSPVEMALNLKKRAFTANLNSLKEEWTLSQSETSRWPISASVVESIYEATSNSITIPSAMMQPFYFHVNFTDTFNYAGIGIAIAHTFTHAFSHEGLHYDKEGNLTDWLSDETVDTILVRGECLEQMYSYKYKDLEIKLDGERTLNENTADFGGIKLAFTAYKELKEKASKFEGGSLGSYSDKELFFIHFGTSRCHLVSTPALRYQVLNEPHAPEMLRILYPLINSEDFASSFSCSNSTLMVPKTRCKVW